MKSKRAKDATDYFVSWFKGMNQPKIREGIENIVLLAEQDAEQRAVKAAKQWFMKLFPTITHPATIDIMVDDFIELLNNGEQSNE